MFIVKKNTRIIIATLAIVISGIAAILGWTYLAQKTSAADMSKFDPGNIMSDAVMSNKDSMSVQQIQAFLNSKNACNNTNTYMASWYPHLQYTIRDGKFVCMAQDTFNGKSAAQIIWQVGQDYNINPQFLIVLLEKEQGLVTDTWPNHIQYRSATGFGCPDTAACDSKYFGLENQLRNAANLFRTVLNGGWSNYPVGWTYVQYNPNASCGGKVINIQNRATSALYRYTPYQPNQSAINAGYGLGDGCGAYGNRNTWALFTDWFGNPNGGIQIKRINFSAYSFSDAEVTASFSISNTTNSSVNVGRIGVGVRGPSGENLDMPITSSPITIRPQSNYTYSASVKLNGNEGSYRFFVIRFDGSSWYDPPFAQWGALENGAVSLNLHKQPVVSSPLMLSSKKPHSGEMISASFTVKNPNLKTTIKTPRLMVAARGPGSKNHDLLLTPEITLGPQESYAYSQNFTFPTTGPYSFYITSFSPGINRWNDLFPVLDKNILPRRLEVSVTESMTITQGIDINLEHNTNNSNATASFKVKNFSTKPMELGVLTVAARDSQNRNRDFPLTPYITLQPGEEYTYRQQLTLDASEKYNFWIANFRNTAGWSDDFPISENSSLVRRLSN